VSGAVHEPTPIRRLRSKATSTGGYGSAVLDDRSVHGDDEDPIAVLRTLSQDFAQVRQSSIGFGPPEHSIYAAARPREARRRCQAPGKKIGAEK